MIELERATALRATPAEVWRHAASFDGANHELSPWLRMTVPPEARGLTLDDALGSLAPDGALGEFAPDGALGELAPDGALGELGPLPEPLIVSRVLLLGVIPIERMRVTLTALEPGRRFVEQSPMLTMRSWRHERTIDPTATGCRLSDRLSFEPLLRSSAPLLRRLGGALFAHRHRRLLERFG